MTDTSWGPGTLLAGRFRLEDLLDESAGARFWRATDRVLARSVAVHVLPDSDPRADALLQAARSSALVSGTRLLRVLDAAAADGVVYVVNEWGSGVSLDRMLAEGVLSPRRAAWVVKEAAEAVSTAHRNGVAHGRLLPENVMVTESGSVKLVGFVIDAALRSPDGHQLATDGTSLSALESDVVNLAALLYAALVGRWPGTEGSTIPVAPTEHGHPLRPRRVRAGVPRPLDAICERVLNTDLHPSAPPISTAHEIMAALSDYIGDPGGSTVASWGQAPWGAAQEATRVLNPAALDSATDALPGEDAAADPGPDTEDIDGQDLDAGDIATVGSPLSGHAASLGADPEATQAGTPVFGDGQVTDWQPAASHRFVARSGNPDEAAARPGDWARGTGVDGRPAGPAARVEPSRRTPSAEPADRPLFADGAARRTGPDRPGTLADDDSRSHRSLRESLTSSFAGAARDAHTGEQRSVGAGNGQVPSVWGPDADAAPSGPSAHDPHQPHDDDEVPGRRWLRLAVGLAALVVLVAAAVFAVDLWRTPSGGGSATDDPTQAPRSAAAAATKVKIAGVTDFDPEANPPVENPELAPLAIDGNKSTAWQTVTYRNHPDLGGLKSGVGLRVDLGKATAVGEVKLTLQGTGTSLQLLAAPGATTKPTDLTGLRRVASATDAGTAVDLRLKKPVTTRWLVVWLTELPAADGGFEGRIAEISVRS